MGSSTNDHVPHRPGTNGARRHGKTLILFDVDGTLAVPAQPATPEMLRVLEKLRAEYAVGIVGAGDFQKQQTQLGGGDLRTKLDFVFSENGVHAFRGEQIHCKSMEEHLGKERWQAFQTGLDEILAAEKGVAERLLKVASPAASIADRGTFLERRQCTVNVCPIGRTPGLSKEERASFEKADKENGMRRRVVAELKRRFGPDTEFRLLFSIGGQIGIDVCPVGWDKTFCLQFVCPEEFPVIHFFGDNTHEGGGDHEIYIHPRVRGHTVKSPEDTIQQLERMFLSEARPASRRHGDTLILFDVDGTLAIPAQPAKPEMLGVLERLKAEYAVGLVGAGDFEKQQTQLGGGDLRAKLDFVFSENGVHAFRGEQIHCKSIVEHLGEDKWQAFQTGLDEILAAEREVAERLLKVASPDATLAERGTFLERRQCTVNVCPIGRTPGLSKEARASFDKADKEDGMRRRVVAEMKRRFGPDTEFKLLFSIGGQIGIDVCPVGWDKTFCLQFVSPEEFPVIHFFGDNTHEGGGDHEIYVHPRVKGHTVKSPEDTIQQLERMFLSEVRTGARRHGDTLILFDVDGTLAVPAQPASQEMLRVLEKLRAEYAVGIVGAGDFEKQQTQLGGGDLRAKLDFVFSENGVHAFRGEQIHCKSIVEHLGEDKWQAFQTGLDEILAAEREVAERLLKVASPDATLADRGTFLERRQCTVNVCPIGRTPGLSKEARASFDKADKEDGMRRRVVAEMKRRFGPDTEFKLLFSIGGQIGIDVCPVGWDKTFCLQFVSPEEFPVIHFFGDNTHEGGGDHEIYVHPRTEGHTVKSPEDTIKQIEELFFQGPSVHSGNGATCTHQSKDGWCVVS